MTLNRIENPDRRRVLKTGIAASSMFLPAPYAWVWAQSEGALKLLRAPKMALVMGNGKYKDAPELKNAPNDAKAIGDALKSSGFAVTLKLDTAREEMLGAIRDYVHLMEQKQHVGLFYFAGHGIQLAWRNYLLPVDASIDKIDDVAKHGVDIARLMDGLTKAANPMNVIILDACRENPFGKDFRVEHKGLSQMDAPQSTLLAYATSPGNVASDGDGANGLYTENLLREIKVPEAKVEDVFKRVRLGVRRKSNGAQIPWESTSLEEDFWFLPPKELKKLSDEEKDRLFKEEFAIWEKAQSASASGPLEDYLRRFPNGKFSELAQLQLDRVLAKQGESRVAIASQEGNPFTKGSAEANTAYKIGDSYTYRIVDISTRLEKGSFTATVTKISDNDVTFDSGLVTDLLGNVQRHRDGRRVTPTQFLPLEFAVGKRWSTRYITTRPDGLKSDGQMEITIPARERIVIPAGTFDAFRIEGRGVSVDSAGRRFDYIWNAWFEPARVRRPIVREEIRKFREKILSSERTELTAYKQS